MAATLLANITETGMNQGDIVKYFNNILDIVNELQTDHATIKTLTDELNTDGDAVFVDLTAIHAAILAGNAQLDLDGGVTDTDYAANNDPAALTATAIAASGVATLTNADALKLTKG